MQPQSWPTSGREASRIWRRRWQSMKYCAQTSTWSMWERVKRWFVTFSLDIGPIFVFCLIFPYLNPTSLIICRLHWTASFISLIPYHPNLRSTFVLSSGRFLIALSVAGLLSCMIHQPTKWWYCRLWTMSPLSLYFTRSESLSSI